MVPFPPGEANPVVHPLHFPDYDMHTDLLFKAFEISECQ